MAKVLNVAWQRCRVHFMRNALARARNGGRRVVSAFIAACLGRCRGRTSGARLADQLRPKLPKIAAFPDEAETDVLALMTFPPQH